MYYDIFQDNLLDVGDFFESPNAFSNLSASASFSTSCCPATQYPQLTTRIGFGEDDTGWDTMTYMIRVLNTINDTAAVGGYTAGASEFYKTADWMNQTAVPDTDGINITASAAGQWINTINGYAKAVYCTVLSDLGQAGQYNMLASPEPGQAFVTQVFDLSKTLLSPDDGPYDDSDLWGGFATEVGDEESPPPGSPPLGNSTAFFNWFYGAAAPTHNPSTISAEYLCQVPVRKPWGSLLVSVLVADIVFLQVLWTVLKWVVTLMVERGQEDANYCLGCAQKTQHDMYEMVPAASTTVAKPGDVTALEQSSINSGRRSMNSERRSVHSVADEEQS